MSLLANLRRLALLLISALLVACGAAAGQPAAPSPPLKFGYDLWPGYYPVLIAQERGFFSAAGLEVQAIHPERTDSMMADFTAGKYDAIAVALGDIVSLTQSDPDLRIVLITDELAGGDAIVASAGVQSLADLRGKRIGVNLGGFAELLVTQMLAAQNLTTADVTLVDLDAADLPAKLASGEVQAGHTWEPYVTQAVAAGGKVIFSSADTPGLIPDAVAFRGATVRERPAAVRAFVQGWFQAVDYWNAHPAEGTHIAAQKLNLPDSDISLQGLKLKTLADNRALFQRGTTTASLHYTTQLYLDFYARIGTLRRAPNLDQLLDATFVAPQ